MFIGEYQHNLDNKNRIMIPAKLRQDLGDKCIMTKGLDGCLYIYPMEEWGKFEEKLKSLPLTSKDVRAFTRFFFAGAAEIEIDKQGRALIPQNLIDYSGIKKEIVSIGVMTRIEIWSRDKWNEYNNQDVDFEGILDKMEHLGI